MEAEIQRQVSHQEERVHEGQQHLRCNRIPLHSVCGNLSSFATSHIPAAEDEATSSSLLRFCITSDSSPSAETGDHIQCSTKSAPLPITISGRKFGRTISKWPQAETISRVDRPVCLGILRLDLHWQSSPILSSHVRYWLERPVGAPGALLLLQGPPDSNVQP